MDIKTGRSIVNPYVFLDIKIGEEKAGRVVIELFRDIVPKTTENFLALCTGKNGTGKLGKSLCYKGTLFHRAEYYKCRRHNGVSGTDPSYFDYYEELDELLGQRPAVQMEGYETTQPEEVLEYSIDEIPIVPQFMVQGGDITRQDGTGGESIYGEKFDDENFTIAHTEEGRVGMANAGQNTNNSQFYITTVPCEHLDNINVVFGQVRKGLNIIREMGDIPRIDDHPTIKCLIENCGELTPNEPWNIGENDGTADVYPPWPDDWDIDQCEEDANSEIEEAILNIKDSGNFYFKQQNYIDSDRKYRKALRYIDFWSSSAKNGFNSKLVEAMKVSSLLNLAAVRLKKHRHQDARLYCDQALVLEPNNGKAFYRRAQARMGLKDYDKALADLKTALRLCPNDRFIQLELQNARRTKLNYLQKEKVIFSKMFQ